MEIRHLRYFLTVAEEKNFRRASSRLNISQSSISRQIRDLEDEIGVKLFDRAARRVSLTASGEAFLQDTYRILAEIQDAVERARRTMLGFEGDLHIAFTELAARSSIFRQCVSWFRTTAPNVHLKLTAMPSDRQLEAINRNEIDIGFLAIRDEWRRANPHLEFKVLRRERMLLALPPTHPLTLKKTIFMKDLAEQPIVCLPRSQSAAWFDELFAEFRRRGLVPKIVQTVVGELNVLGLVSTGIGIGFVSSSAASREHTKDVVYRHVKDLKWTQTMGAVSSALNRSTQASRVLTFLQSKSSRSSGGRRAKRLRSSNTRRVGNPGKVKAQ